MRLNQFHQKARLSAALAIDQLRSIFAKSADGTVTRSLDLSELEDRILLSVSPAAVIAESAPSAVETIEVASPLDSGSTSAVESPSAAAGSSSSNPESDSLTTGEASSGTLLETSSASELQGFAGSLVLEENSATEQSATEVIFVDQAVEDFDELVADLQAQRDAGRAIDFFVLDSNADGIDQIAETLEQYSDLDAVHIVSHGSDGSVKLGSHWLRIGSLDGYAGTIAGWGSAFSADGDLLFYGCDLAAGSRGELLVESIAALTGADVAASTDDTGSALRGGDWDLEFHHGLIETSVAFSAAVQNSWKNLLAVANVDTTLDVLDGDTSSIANLISNKGADGFISLREAITAANNTAGTDDIFLGAGTFTLSLTGGGENLAATGDLDINESVNIVGAGSGLTTIDATGLNDRVFHVRTGTLDMQGVTVTGGGRASTLGGGFRVGINDALTLTDVVVTGNTGNNGGGIFSTGTVTITDSVISANTADGGAGLAIDDGSATLTRVTVTGNIATGNAGGLETGGTTQIIDSTIDNNQAASGAGIVNDGGSLTLTNVTISTNTATVDAGAIFNKESLMGAPADLALTNVTIADNSAPLISGIKQFGSATTTIKNTILDNAGDNGDGSFVSQGGNFDSDGSAGITGATIGDPVLGPLADNGGPTQTYALLPGSSAINNGVSGGPALDQRGLARDASPDAGAFELQGTLLAYESFSYGSGMLEGANGGTGFTNAWTTTTGTSANVNATGLTSPTGTLPVAGGTAEMNTSSQFTQGRDLATSLGGDGTTAWFSYLLTPEDISFGGISLTLSHDGSGDYVTIGTSSNDFLITRNASTFGAARIDNVLVQGQTYFLTVKVDFAAGNDTVTLYVDPTPGLASPDSALTTQLTTADLGTFTQIGLIGGFSGNNSKIDEIRVGESFADVAPSTGPNQTPTADAGGAYVINEGETVNLVASASSDPDFDPLTFKWDLDNDGTFGEPGEPVTETPTVSWATLQSFGIDDDGVYTIGVQVDDGNGGLDTATTTLTVTNVTPTLMTTGSATTSVGSLFTLNLSAVDPGADSVSSWTINWGDGTIDTFAGNPSSVTHTYTNAGFTYNILASAVDEDGVHFQNELLVASSGNDRVLRFGPDASFLQAFATSDGSDYPVDVIIGPDGNTYLSGWTSNDVLRYDTTTGAFIDAIVPAGTGGLNSAAGLAFGSDGNLYVASRLTSEVLRFDGTTGAFIDAFVTAASGGLNQAEGLTFGPDGNLYVSDYQGDAVFKYDGTTGAFDSVFVSAGSGGLNRPEDLTFGPDGNLYVADDTGSSVLRYNGTTGAFIDAFVPSGSNGLASATGLAFGPDGNLYVGSWGTDSVKRFNGTTGAFIDNYIPSGSGGLLETDYLNFVPGHQVSVTNNPPAITSDGGGATAAVNVAENTTAVTTVTATDTDLPAQTLSYSISGGADQALFNIDSGSGVLTFASARDFESPADANTDNVYEVTVQVSDGVGGIDSQDISVTVTDVVEGNVVVVDTTSDVADGNTSSIGALLGSKGADGRISLREAILAANNTTNAGTLDEIHFNIADNDPGHFYYADDSTPGALLSLSTTTVGDGMIGDFDPDYPYAQHSWFTIDLNTALPRLEITDAVIIDGYTQAGATVNTLIVGHNASLRIELTSTGADGNRGITVLDGGDGSIIRGLAINGFDGSEIMVEPGADGVTIQGNFLGTDITGTKALGDGDAGVHLRSSNNLVGGPNVADRNLLSGNDSRGVTTFTFGPIESGNVIQNNYIGTDATGLNALGNSLAGLQVYNQDGLQILDNVISGNTGEGVWFRDIAPSNVNVVVQGNLIGVGADGTTVVANSGNGILADGPANSTTIGGSGVGEGNVIAGNTGDGIRLDGSGATGISIQGNAIGTDAGGTLNLGNGGHGILFRSNAQDNVVGGTLPGEGNTIAFNSGDGVAITQNGTDRNAIRGNAIFGNTGIGIDLNNDGVTNNDAGDGDGGPNLRQNFPVLSTASVSGSDLTVTGTLNSTAGTTFQIDFYASASADGSGHGEGERYLGSASVLTNGSGNATISELLSGASVSVGEFVTATATDPTGNTSEFALNAVAVSSNSPPTITSNGGGAAAAINVSENTTAVTTVTANDTDLPAQTLTYSISGGADQTLFNIDSGSGVLTFVSAPDFETPTDANTDNIYHVTVQVSDGQGGTDSQNISVTVTPVNEAPVNTVPGLQVISADEPLVFSTANGNAVQISDVDAGSSPLQVTLAATNATLTLSGTTGLTFSTGDGTGDATMTFTGSLTSINSALEGLTLTPSPNFTGSASLQVTTNDQGNTGAGGSLGDSDNVSVTVNAVSLTPTNEFRVNSNTINVQETSSEGRGSHRAVSIAPDGNYVVVWSSQSQDGSGFGVYGQRFNKNGVALGSEFLINQTTTSDQKWATVATDGAGNFVVAWSSQNQDGSGAGVYARRYDASGTALSGEFLVNTTTSLDQDSPSVAMADDGRFIIVWTGNGSGDSSGIFGRLYDKTGSAVGNEFLINTSTFGTQSDAAVAMNADGRFVAVWDDSGGFHGRRFDASGTPQGNQFTIDSSISSGNGSVAMGSAGNFVATWRETVIDRAIFAQRYDSTGSTIGGQIGVNTTTPGDQTHPSIDLDEAGSFVIVWEGNGVGDANGVFGQKFDTTGTAVDGEFRINQTTTGGQQNASVALLDGDNFVVAWSGDGAGDTSGVFARHYSSGVNNVPTADAGGPYVINEDDSLNLNGAASGDPDSDPLTYAWDLDNDGNYGEAGEPTTVSPTVSWATLQSFGITDDGIYTIGLQVDDGNGGVDSATTMLTINNVPPTITSSSSVNVSENTTAVLTVAATDPVDTVTYSLSGGVDQGLFTIDFTTGALSFAAAPDFEIPADNDTNNVYQVEVTASDGDGGTDVQTLSVTVIDQNDETPVVTPGQTFNVSETAANGTSLGNVLATDADAGTTFSNWQITGGNAAGIFGINAATGQLSVVNNSNLDFETTTGYVLSITVSDGVNTSAVETVSISVLDQNDETPVVTPGQTFNVSEAAANGSSLGNVLATDADAGTTFSNWTITGGNSDGIFTINGSTGELIVADNTNLDFETASGYVLSLTVSDGTNTSSVETVSVNVVDANEAPGVSLSPTSSSLSENADTSSAIILSVISVTDDALGTNSLSLSGIDAADFEIVGSSLRLRAGTPLDFETKPTYNVTVEVNDPLVGSSPDDSQSFTLTINDVNEAPTTSGLSNVVVNEDSPNVPITLTTAFSDAETASSLLTYSVIGNSTPALFNAASISGGTLTLDFAADAHGSSVITVQASDPAGATVSTAFTVTVQPVPDAPVATGDSYEVTENSLAVTASTGVLANDSDADGDALTALLISGPSNGSLVLLSDGGFTYTPDSAFSGIDSFVYQPFDGTSVGPARSVTLMVTRVAAPPPSSTDPGAGEPSDSTTPTESDSSTESTEREPAETSVESTPAVAEPIVAENAAGNVEAEPVQTEASTDDDRDDQMMVAYAIDSNDVSEFFGRGSDRLELRDAESVRIASVRLDESTGDSSSSADSFRSSLRFDGEDLSYLVSTEFIAELEQVEEEFVFEGTVPEWAAGTAVATTTGLSVGYIMWMLRGGYVLASVLSTMPVWQNVDPLPVLAALDAADDGDDESLETMIDRASEEADQSEVQATDDAPADGKRKEELQ